MQKVDLNFVLNTNLFIGENKKLEISSILKELNLNEPLLILDKFFYKNMANLKFLTNSGLLKCNNVYHYELNFEPSYQYIDSLKKKILKSKVKFDFILAIGGGSVMDTAKALAYVLELGDSSINYRGFFSTANHKVFPVVCIPTTIGTASEVVYKASLINEIDNVKLGINYKKNYPIASIIDPTMVMDAPKEILISSGLDALVHCIESYGSIKSNDITRALSSVSYKKLSKSLKRIFKGTKDKSTFLDAQLGAIFAMLAMSNTSPGPMTVLSYFVGPEYKIPHGIAGGIFIDIVIENNKKNGFSYLEISSDSNFYDDINEILSLCNIRDNQKNIFEKINKDKLIEYVKNKPIQTFNPSQILIEKIIKEIDARK